MAGDWLKWQKGLTKKREVLAISKVISETRRETAAILMELWEWADENTIDGHVASVTPDDVDAITGVDGLAEAMIAVNWLIATGSGTDSGVEFPKFDRHNGKSAKTRDLANERKRKAREAAKSATETVTPPPPQTSRPQRDQIAVREEREVETEEEVEGKDTAYGGPLRTSWKNKDYQLQVRQIAREKFNGKFGRMTEADRRKLLAVAAIHASGDVPENWLNSSLDAFNNLAKRPDSPLAYFASLLVDKWPKAAAERFGPFVCVREAIADAMPAEMLEPATNREMHDALHPNPNGKES